MCAFINDLVGTDALAIVRYREALALDEQGWEDDGRVLTAAVHTFTEHTFRCSGCHRLARASVEAIAAQRAEEPDARWTDEEIAQSFEFCLACVDGIAVDGEHVVLQ